VRSQCDGRLPCWEWLHPTAGICSFEPARAIEQLWSPVCTSFKDRRRVAYRSIAVAGPRLCMVYLPPSHQQVPWPSSNKKYRHSCLELHVIEGHICSHLTLLCFVNFVMRLCSNLSTTPARHYCHFTNIHIHACKEWHSLLKLNFNIVMLLPSFVVPSNRGDIHIHFTIQTRTPKYMLL